jgi:hypothetical protein
MEICIATCFDFYGTEVLTCFEDFVSIDWWWSVEIETFRFIEYHLLNWVVSDWRVLTVTLREFCKTTGRLRMSVVYLTFFISIHLGYPRACVQVQGLCNISKQVDILRWEIINPSPKHKAEGLPFVGCP